MDVLTAADHARIAAAIKAAEATTSGEIFCILSSRRTDHPEIVLGFAALAAFALPMLAVLAGWEPWAVFDRWELEQTPVLTAIETFVALQLITFFAAAALLLATGAERFLTPGRLRVARLHRLARAQFLAHGLHETDGRTGVLIFVSLADHYAEVVADSGIYAKVPPEHWGDTVAALIARAKAGDVVAGFEEAIALAGRVLGEHFPPGALNPNEVSDRLVQI